MDERSRKSLELLAHLNNYVERAEEVADAPREHYARQQAPEERAEPVERTLAYRAAVVQTLLCTDTRRDLVIHVQYNVQVYKQVCALLL